MLQYNDTVDFRRKQVRASLQKRVPKTIEPVVPPRVPDVIRTVGGPENDTVLSTTPMVPEPAPALPENVSESWNQGAGQAGYGNFESPERKALRLSAQRKTPAGYGI